MKLARIFESPAARQAVFEETQRNARIDAVERARKDLAEAARGLAGRTDPLAVSSAALFEFAADRVRGGTDVAEFPPLIVTAVRCARAVLLGSGGAR